MPTPQFDWTDLNWPDYDKELDCYYMPGPNGWPVYGQSSDECLANHAEACHHARKQQEQPCLP